MDVWAFVLTERIHINKKSPTSLRTFLSLRDPEGIRTPGRLLRRQMLYPTELRDHSSVKKERQPSCLFFVGVAGFEPTTSCSQSRRDTGLRYTPNFITPQILWRRERDSNPRYPYEVRQFSKRLLSASQSSLLRQLKYFAILSLFLGGAKVWLSEHKFKSFSR